VRIKFSARAWMLSIATGLVFLPTMDVEAQSGPRTVQQAVVSQTPEPAEAQQQSLVKRQLNAIYGRFSRKKPSQIQQTAGEQVQGEPRRLSAQPATRAAIKESKPASRRLFPSLFPRKKTATAQAAPQSASNETANERVRKMYEREGREVPSYLLDSNESSNREPNRFQRVQPAKPAQQLKVQAATPTAKPAGEIRQVSNNPFKRFFSKLNPLRRSSKPKRESEKPDHVEPLPDFARQERQRLERYVPPAPISAASNPTILPQIEAVREIEAVKEVVNKPSFTPSLPELDLPKAPALLPDEEALDLNDLPDFKPAAAAVSEAVGELKDLGNIAIEEVAIEEVQNAVPTLKEDLTDTPVGAADPLDNPFPELSEDKADDPKVEDNPFTGLTLDAKNGSGSISAEPPALPQLPDLSSNPTDSIGTPALPDLPDLSGAPALENPAVEEPAFPELPPLQVGEPDFGKSEVPDFGDNKLPEFGDDKLPEIKVPETKVPELPAIEEPTVEKKSKHSDKLQKIAERKELMGLKGFCPVELRDNRGLTDALPEFSAEFEGVTYNFSSSEAQQKFEKTPAKYAPAAGGRDIVKSNDDSVVAGSLDHAVWYKDRLYMFATKAAMHTFVIEPAKYGVAK
jgi:YHS domain-containing protein